MVILKHSLQTLATIKMKVAIVGAGLAGSLLAGLLGKRGMQVDVYEKSIDPRLNDQPAGRSINLALSTRGRTALKMLGIEEQVVASCIPMYGRLVHNQQGDLTSIPYGIQDQAILSVGRHDLNTALIDASEQFPGVNFHFKAELEHVDLPNHPSAKPRLLVKRMTPHTLPSREPLQEVECDLVIGADGSFSRVRNALERKRGVNFSQRWLGHGYKELCIPPTASGDFALSPNALHIWPKGTHMMIALPNPDKSFTVTLFMPLEELKSIKSTAQVSQLFLEQFPDAVPLMPTLQEDFAENPVGHLCTIRTDPWSWLGCCTLVGDAAHAIVPFYGQGMNAALEDCTVLDRMLDIYRHDVPKALTEFSRLRIKEANVISDLSHANYEEMRSSVTSTWFRMRRGLEQFLHRLMPDHFLPLYTMVAFTNMPYSAAVKQSKRQDRWLDILLAAGPTAVLALLAAPASRRLLARH